MPSNIPALKVQLQQERDLLAAMVANIDIPAERALIEAAQAAYEPKARRWALMQDKITRLEVLDQQLALLP